tara:strand:- start:994 stop:1389 length:396 start_codon:yes stop_codon:yes gene_type:complete
MKTLAKMDGNTVVNIEAIDEWRCTNDNGQIDESVAKNHLIKTGANPDEYILYMPDIHINAPEIGGTYDSVNNKFINKKPHSSWELNTTNWLWQPVGGWPADSKHNGGTKAYFWNTETESIEPVIDGEPEEE